MRTKKVMANWKMNLNSKEIQTLLKNLLAKLAPHQQEYCALFPPTIYLPLVQQLLAKSEIQWGGQNVSSKDSGAYTGEHSVSMLTEYGCRYILVGHSERRHLFQEDEKIVAEKFHHVKDRGIIPVLCVGETLEEREKDLTEAALYRQIAAVLKVNAFQNIIIAYEPVWAIGTGKTASPAEAQDAHVLIRKIIAQWDPHAAQLLPIIYGGSVNENNAQALFSMPDVDGGLVGNASLNAQQFVEIVQCIN